MKNISVDITINAPLDKVWSVFTDIENSDKNLNAITNIEIVDNPKIGIVGLKWKEARAIFGKEATEEMWISDAQENKSYVVLSDSHGMKYKTTFYFEQEGDNVKVTMEFGGEAVSLSAKLMQPTLLLMRSTLRKQLKKDLDDLKVVCESK